MSNQQSKPIRLGITMGDANGIGPELIIKAFLEEYIQKRCIAILYGSARVLNIHRKVLDFPKLPYSVISNVDQARPGRLNVIDCSPEVDRIEVGVPSRGGARVALEALQAAIADAQHGSLDALVTLPVDKASLQQLVEDFTGHTEMLGNAFGAPDPLMMMVSEDMRVGLATNHLSIANVAKNVSTKKIVQKLELLHRSLHNDFGISKGKIAVLGLNPHAGDHGLLGKEEAEIIIPAIEEAKNKGIMAVGPFPADGFFGSLTYRKFDAVLAMYHDQGLVPFKLMSGFHGVNFTAGMPIVRTSPDHGVAYDIAGEGKAHVASFREAVHIALDVFKRREEIKPLVDTALGSVKNPILKEPELPEVVTSSAETDS
ncbi:MAG: 4-hydroxythreonine-4-phosphate dehydrogenase PdxA [Bacteroidia bacterium]